MAMGYDHGDGRCMECDGTHGNHFPGCVYDGMDVGSGGYKRAMSNRSAQSESNAFFFWYIMAAVIGFCYNELIGAIILIILGLIMMAK